MSGQISSRPSGPPWKLIAGISLGVVGIVGIAVGAYLVSIDGTPTCDSPDPTHSCPQLYNTVGGGGTMIALGIASLGGAGALLYLHFRPAKSQAAARVMITPLPGGVMAGIGGRF